MKAAGRSTLFSLLIVTSLFLYGCNGGSSGETPLQSAPVPAVCQTAFDTGGGSGAVEGEEPAPVALSSCTPDAQKNVQIGGAGGCGPDVVVDKDFTGAKALGKITIQSGGKLVFPDLADPDLKTPNTLELATAGIEIQNGGLFSVGTAACPIGYHPGAKATLTFTGSRDPNCNPIQGCDNGSVKGIEVRSGGSLRLYGDKGVPHPADPGAGAPSVSWTVLNALAAAGTRTLHLAGDVTAGQRPWEDGDWIAVGTSSFSPFETEFVQIMGAPKAETGGSTVTLAQDLQYSHFGSEAPTASQLCEMNGKSVRVACGSVGDCTTPCTSAPSTLNYGDPAAKNFGVDERAEVGLITRSIRLRAEMPAAPPPDQNPLNPDPSLHWGGEIRIAGGDKPLGDIAIVGVELEKFGKDQLGSYPIHVHMIGDAKNKPRISANSVHHSFNKCITVHMSSNLTFDDNVCARIVGHIFYEEYGSEENISFQRNLGLGAMSNSFDIYKVKTTFPPVEEIPRSELIKKYWWPGDNLATGDYNYDGFNIPNTDDQQNPTHGSCQIPDGNGGFSTSLEPFTKDHPGRCNANEFYVEPASGFWITNPTTELLGNAIGGCQGVGRGFWWVPPPKPILVNGQMQDLKFKPLGIPGHPQAFFDNRAHGCYAGFYAEEEYSVHSTVLVPHKGGLNSGQPLIARLDGMTATRNRFRGVWLRPTWFVVEHGRFATNRENVSLVTSGGIDGNAPGVWALLQNSVVVGVSKNNVDRFGPCPRQNDLGDFTGSQFGCIDHTPARFGVAAHSGDEVGLGYPPPSWNMFGYMLYDGPVRVFHDRFVNFKHDVSSLLTDKDNTFLGTYSSFNTPTAQVCVEGDRINQHCSQPKDCCDNPATCPNSCPLPNVLCGGSVTQNCCAKAEGCNVHFTYEGDAALGWFQSNQSSYPTGTVTRELSFENTDLRHQIYTEKVSVNLEFNDGDKNTAVIDEDGTLTGYDLGDPTKGFATRPGFHPISLNNLPFNATSNSVDECFSRGAQNDAFEGRDSSLISAGSMGTLEFSSLYPWQDMTAKKEPIPFPGPDGDVTHTQFLTFQRDDPELDANGMPRKDMNGKIIHASMKLHSRDGRGVWEPKLTSGFGYTASASPAPNFPASTGKAGIAHVIDVGIADVVKPDISADKPFFVRLGICYTNADGQTHPQDPGKFSVTRGYKSYTGGFVDPTDPELLKYWSPSDCNNLDSLRTVNITTPTCPGPRERRIAVPESGICPNGSTKSGTSCVFPTDKLDFVADTQAMLNPNGTPNLETYTYDKTTGMLFLWVAQDEPNPVAPSPLGSCTGNAATDDPSCPDVAKGETYYACPAKGCHVYLISVDDYTPGPSNCQPYETFTHAPFETPDELVLYGTKTPVQQVFALDKAGEPFHTPSQSTDPKCMLTTAVGEAMAAGAAMSPSSAPAADAGVAATAGASGGAADADAEAEKAAAAVEAAPVAGSSSPAGATSSGGAGARRSGSGPSYVRLPAPTATATPSAEATPVP